MLDPGDKFREYTLIEYLGEGTFGEVWRAEKPFGIGTNRKSFALKFIFGRDGRGADYTKVQEEVDTSMDADGHPNVNSIVDAFIERGRFIIVTDFASGGSLDDWLKRHGHKAPTVDKAAEIIRGILNGLMYLHSKNIVHRDLKPENILMQGEIPRISDFGVSRVITNLSRTNTPGGSPLYMSPESFRQSKKPSVDIWSVGIIFYQLLSGSHPYHADDAWHLRERIEKDDPAPLPAAIPVEIRRVVEKALQKSEDRRYRSAAEMLDRLNDAVFAWKSRLKNFSETEVDTDYNKPPAAPVTPPPTPRPEPAPPSGGPSSPHERPAPRPFAPAPAAKRDNFLAITIGVVGALFALIVVVAIIANSTVSSDPGGSPTPYRVNAATPTPVPTPTPNYDIPEIKGMITEIKFFESPKDMPVVEQRKYGTVFEKSATRYVSYQLKAEFPTISTRQYFKVEYVLFNGDKEENRHTVEHYADSGWSNVIFSSGYGSESYGTFSVGTYRLEIRANGRLIKTANFEIKESELPLSGNWTGWGDITISGGFGVYTGTYSTVFGTGRGTFKINRTGEGLYTGTWADPDGKHKGVFNKIIASKDGKTLTVTWSSTDSREDKKTNETVTWTRKPN